MLRVATRLVQTRLHALRPALSTTAVAGEGTGSSGSSGGAAAGGGRVTAVPTVGIDLGTTNSCVAVVESKGASPRVLENEEGHRTTPSIVGFQADGTRIVGQPAKRGAVTNPKGTVYGAKRLIGRAFDDAETQKDAEMVPYDIVRAPNGDAWVSVHGKEYSPSQIGAFVLTKMQETAARHLGGKPDKAVITVPAYFNDSQRQATKDAGRIAGFKSVRIVNEPTAAALSYGINVEELQTIAVYDLGGGTFDISILEVSDGIFEVKSTNGDSSLGGEDFDEAILNHMISSFKAKSGVDLSGEAMAIQRLREAAEESKRRLDSSASTEVNLPFIAQNEAGPVHFELTFTREELESLTGPLIEKTREPALNALRDAQLSPEDIDRVLLVGGMTRMPKVVETVEDIFGKSPFKGVNPDEAVAAGAAIQGAVLDGAVSGIALLDVTPLSLGTSVEGGLFARIINRNTPIPAKKTKVFTTAADNQTHISAGILQGDREMAADNKELGTLNLDGIPPMRRGVPQIEVSFELDAEGILKVTATDMATGVKSETVVQAAGGLSEAEIESMVRDAEIYAEEDKARRAAIEVKNEAESLVHSTRDSIASADKILTDADRLALHAKVDALEAVLQAGDAAAADDIKAKMAALQDDIHNVFEAAYKKNAPSKPASSPPPSGDDPNAQNTESK